MHMKNQFHYTFLTGGFLVITLRDVLSNCLLKVVISNIVVWQLFFTVFNAEFEKCDSLLLFRFNTFDFKHIPILCFYLMMPDAFLAKYCIYIFLVFKYSKLTWNFSWFDFYWNALLNLISNQPDNDKIYLYARDPYEAKYQLLINKKYQPYHQAKFISTNILQVKK